MSAASISSDSKKKDGIDIRLAMEVLSQRASMEHTCHIIHPSSSSFSTTPSNHHHSSENDNRTTWGQRIDIVSGDVSNDTTDTTTIHQQQQQQLQNGSTECATTGSTIDDDDEEMKECACPSHRQQQNKQQDKQVGATKKENYTKPITTTTASSSNGVDNSNNTATTTTATKLTDERTKRKEEIKEKIRGMSRRDLLHYILQTQEQRVVTYKKYNSGLEDVIRTGNLTYYPAICADATASFAVLSDIINCILEILSVTNNDAPTSNDNNGTTNDELRQLLQQLQKYESNKLNYTAAYHLERIRGGEQQQQSATTTTIDTTTPPPTNNSNNNSTMERLLLQQGAQSLRTKINTCIEGINEILDEIRAAIVDEDDNDNEQE